MANETAPAQFPPPQVVAMQAYVRMVTEMSKEKIKPEEVTERTRQAVITAIECACRAQRAADALLLDVLADRQPALTDRAFGEYLARVLRGEEKPKESLGTAAGLLTLP